MTYCRAVFAFWNTLSTGDKISIAGILVAVMIFAVTIIFTIRNNRKKSYGEIFGRFQSAFVEIIHELKNTMGGVVFHLGGSIEEGHERAKIELEVALSSQAIGRLNKIWDEYKHQTKQYYAKINGHDQDTSMQWRDEFIAEINSMLKKVSKIT